MSDTFFAQFDGLASMPVLRTRSTSDEERLIADVRRITSALGWHVYSRVYIFKNDLLHRVFTIAPTVELVEQKESR